MYTVLKVNPPDSKAAPAAKIGVQGRKQFLTAKQEMLDEYDRARNKARAHGVETLHGNVAEALFRKWLIDFLPKRYTVTSGFIVSQGRSEMAKLPHFDVIIYDQIASPVLWVENSPDSSAQGMSRAIPVEHVKGVLEIKSAFKADTVGEALAHLEELDSLLETVDSPNERYPKSLPAGFFRAVIFFELRDADRRGVGALRKFLKVANRRGYFKSLVLRGSGLPADTAGTIEVLPSNNVPPQQFDWGKDLLNPNADTISENEMMFGTFYGAKLSFSPNGFVGFAFDIVAHLNGTYETGRLSTFHGFSRALPPQH